MIINALAILTTSFAAAPELTYFVEHGSEANADAYRQTTWKTGDQAFLAVDDGNLRKTADAGGEVVRTLPLGTPLTVTDASAERTKIGLRVDRWYGVEAKIDGATVRGFVFGSSLTPFRFEGDFDGDGEQEIAAVALSGWFAPRVRVLEPGIDKKRKHVAVLNVPSDIRGRTISARFVPRKGRRPPVFELSHCTGDLCTHAFVRYVGKRKQKVGRLRVAYLFEGSRAAKGEVKWRGRSFTRTFCSERCPDLTKFDEKRSDERVASFELESEARGPNEDVPCVPIGTAASGKYRGKQVISCVVTYPGKQSPDQHNPVRYVVASDKQWIELSSTHSNESFARTFEDQGRAKGVRMKGDPTVLFRGMAQTKALYADARGTVTFSHHSTKAWSSTGLTAAFAHEALGPVYFAKDPDRPSFRGAFYVPQPEGSFRVYVVEPRFTKIRWIGGHRGGGAKKYTSARTECGVQTIASDVVSPKAFGSKDLQVAGVTAEGVPLYTLKDLQHPLASALYEEASKRNEKVGDRETFFSSVPAFYRRDSFGRLVRFTRTDLLAPDMCEPVVYFYPTATQRVRMSIDERIEIHRAVPEPVGHTWVIDAVPDGRNVVWWEGVWKHFETPERGFSVPGPESRTFLADVLPKLGLTTPEAADFIAAWAPRLERNAHNTIYFHRREAIDELVPMSITPRPDSLIRVMMDYRGTPTPVEIDAPEISKPPARRGFTVVEWGGVDRAVSNVVFVSG